ncbi:MAG: DMT family transporter [Desulfuromonadaceae bacterium]|nr:DMT family transporter [Desulfuromonas sp.]MDY0185339.1 DMT family transporter [Desulfuromonadaceae bacterium]
MKGKALDKRATENRHERGMVLMLGSALVLPAMDAVAKLLSAQMAVGQISFMRFLLQALMLCPAALMLRSGWRQVLRLSFRAILKLVAAGVLVAAAIVCLYFAQANMPLANAIAIFFVEPLLLTLISALVLKEHVGLRRYVAVAIGLGGAMIVIRPNWAMFGPVAVLPALAALFYAGHLATIRSITAELSGLMVQALSSVAAFTLLGLLLWGGDLSGNALFNWSEPDARAWWLFAAMGVMSTVSHLMLTVAFKYTPASILAPFQYLEIFSATILGYLLFGDFPDMLTWVGTGVIFGSGGYVFYAERRLVRRLK